MTSTLPPKLARLIRQDVQSMHAYAVQDATGLVKLDAMENPHRLSSALQAELGRRLGAVALNRYPGPRIDDLRGEMFATVGSVCEGVAQAMASSGT